MSVPDSQQNLTPPPPQGPSPTPQKAPNTPGLVALIIGLIALAGAVASMIVTFVAQYVPNLIGASALLAIVGLVLGIVALCLKRRRKKAATWATIVSAVALGVAVLTTVVYVVALMAALEGLSDW